MNETTIHIRKLLPEDIQAAMRLVYSEGWNQTERDWQILTGNPLNFCVAAEVDGLLVGTATAMNYSNQVAWIGMVLVNKEYRGRGISKIMLSSIFKELKSCNSIKLDATPAGQQVYEMLGFVEEVQISRMVNTSLQSFTYEDAQLMPQLVNHEELPNIIEFDKQSFGSGRTHLICSLVKDYPEKCWMLKRGNNILGFALGRKGNKYNHIGPVSALNNDYAKILITNAFKKLVNQPVVIDILDDKLDLRNWLTSIGFVKQRGFMRMFLKSNSFPGEKAFQYIITGPEFG